MDNFIVRRKSESETRKEMEKGNRGEERQTKEQKKRIGIKKSITILTQKINIIISKRRLK